MSLYYLCSSIGWSVNELPNMIWNDTELSQTDHHDVKSPLHALKSHERNKWVGVAPLSRQYLEEWILGCFFRLFKLLPARSNVLKCHTAHQRQTSTTASMEGMERLERMPRIWWSAWRMLSRMSWFYVLSTGPLTLNMFIATVYCTSSLAGRS